MVCSALIQAAFITRLSLLRRLLTPLVSGTILMLTGSTVVLVMLPRLSDVSDGAPGLAAPVLVGVNICLLLGFRLYAPPSWQQWGPVACILVGCLLSPLWGIYDISPALAAPWVGAPTPVLSGFDLSFGAAFWALLPGFVAVYLATTINSISDGIALQRLSWRQPRATDFRVVQGAHNLLAAGNLVAAVVGALPLLLSPGISARVVLSGVASRWLGIYGGAILIVAALSPKLLALLTAIPAPVLVSFLIYLMALLFIEGMRTLIRDGLDARRAAVAGVSLWVGIGFQQQIIFPDLLVGEWAVLLGSGMTTGAACVLVLSFLMEVTTKRPRQINLPLAMSSLPQLIEFLDGVAARNRWDVGATGRLRSAGEEALSSLLEASEDAASRRLVVTARQVEGQLELEMVGASAGENLEDRLAYLEEDPDSDDDRQISFRLLRHFASSVRHRQYHDADVLTVRVAPDP
jgi:NCS2 family nucleobase:cation symporter-2/xanthine permease XanP